MPKKSVQLSGIAVAETGLCSIDAERGILMYRGYDIADLAEHATYEEVAYLLLEGELPTTDELDAFREELAQRELPSAVAAIVAGYAREASPMETLRTAVSALSFDDPDEAAIDRDSERRKAALLIAKLPTIVARYERRRSGLDAVPPDPSLSYAENFLTMLRGETPTEQEVRAFDVAMILHAEHELNASTFTARVVAGTLADMHSAVTAAICALKGPIHGGANELAMEFFEEIGSPDRAADAVKERFEQKRKIYGFGHPVYVTTDPRATILKRLSEEFSRNGGEPNWYAITEATEHAVAEQKGLSTNVDLYSGSLYRYLGIPNDLFTPLFAASRVAGWCAHVLEQHANNRIIRPAADYVGAPPRSFPGTDGARVSP
jgi:citrate synthase